MTTGEKITAERKKLGLTQQQFADRLGVTRQAVSRWESDLAFPETDKLIQLSELFDCPIDYLLKYKDEGNSAGQRQKDADGTGEHFRFNFSDFAALHFEYVSKRKIFGMPFVHINIGLGRVAKGFFSFGLVSAGVFSAGLLSMGVFSVGLLSLGLIALGAFSLGGIAFGAIALGLLAFGGVALGLISFGGLALGLFSCGGCSIGLFAVGGYADGVYVAVGDVASARLAFGQTTANGGALSVTPENFGELKEEAWRYMDGLPRVWQGFAGWCKHFAEVMMA